MPAPKSFTEQELSAIITAFHGDAPIKQVGTQFGVCAHKTIRKLWVRHFGQDAYKKRISRLYGAPKMGTKNPMSGKFAEAHPRWAGEKTTSTQGYSLVKAPDWYTGPRLRGRVAEHTVIACQMLGVTRLAGWDIVHHKNENKRDNRPENLEVMNRGKHAVTHRWLRYRRKVQRLSRKGVGPKKGRSAQPGHAGDDIV